MAKTEQAKFEKWLNFHGYSLDKTNSVKETRVEPMSSRTLEEIHALLCKRITAFGLDAIYREGHDKHGNVTAYISSEVEETDDELSERVSKLKAEFSIQQKSDRSVLEKKLKKIQRKLDNLDKMC